MVLHVWKEEKGELVVVFIFISVKSIFQDISIYQSITNKQTNYCGKG